MFKKVVGLFCGFSFECYGIRVIGVVRGEDRNFFGFKGIKETTKLRKRSECDSCCIHLFLNLCL